MLFLDAVTDTSTTALYAKGTQRRIDSKEYVYALISGTGCTVGMVVVQQLSGTTCIGTAAIVAGTRNQVIGVAVGTIAPGYYGWLQTKGFHSAVVTNGQDDISANDALIGYSGTGTVDSVPAGTAPTYKIVGWALADDDNSANTVAAQLCIVV